jgi:hypothetical protein
LIFTAPSVLRKAGGRHAIVVKKGRTKYDVIEMTKNQLLVRKYSEKELQAEGYVVSNTSPSKAAEHFLKHSAGVSPNAKTALEGVIEMSFLE